MISGPVFTVFTAFTSDYKLDIKSTLKYVDFLIENGAKYLYVMPYNSRYLQLTHDEISHLNNSVITHVKDMQGIELIVSGPVECSTAREKDLAKNSFDNGADYFASAFGEKYFSDAQVIDHYEDLAEGTGNIIVHEQPLISGFNSKQMNWPTSLIESVANIPSIVAFKEDAKSAEFGTEILKLELPVTMIFAGRKRLFASLQRQGLSSYLNGISLVQPRLAEKFWNIYQSNDQARLELFVSEVDDPFWDNLASKFGWHRVNKASLQYFGLMDRTDRKPMPHLTDSEFSQLSAFWDKHKTVIEQWL